MFLPVAASSGTRHDATDAPPVPKRGPHANGASPDEQRRLTQATRKEDITMNATNTISARTISRDLVRASKLLRGVGRPAIWRIMTQAAGYSEAIDEEGWQKYLAVVGYRPPSAQVPRPRLRERAIANLANWDGPTFERAEASLVRAYPEQAEKLFRGLEASSGLESVAVARTFLDRVYELRQGTPEDQAAAALLAERKILDGESETLLEQWIADARSVPEKDDGGRLEDDAEYMRRAVALHRFLEDWREQARNVIHRRDYLIQLGLASPRSRSSGDEPEGETPSGSDADTPKAA